MVIISFRAYPKEIKLESHCWERKHLLHSKYESHLFANINFNFYLHNIIFYLKKSGK